MAIVKVKNNSQCAVTFEHNGRSYRIPPHCSITITDKEESGPGLLDRLQSAWKEFVNLRAEMDPEVEAWIEYTVAG